MKKKLFALIAVSLMAVFTVTLFADDDIPVQQNVVTTPAQQQTAPVQQPAAAAPTVRQSASITIDTVIGATAKAGLTNVKSIEFDDGHWKIKTQSANIETEYIYNQQNSQLTQVGQETEDDPQPTADLMSLRNAVKAVQAASYNVISIDFEGSCWKVEARDSKGMKYDILVDINNAQIINTSIDD